jgi:cell division septation protein DedD
MSIAVIIFLAYMWISLLTKSCNKQNDLGMNKEQKVDPRADEFGKEFFDEDTTATTKPDSTIDYKALDKKVESTISTEDEVKTVPTSEPSKTAMQEPKKAQEITHLKPKSIESTTKLETKPVPQKESKATEVVKTEIKEKPVSNGGSFIVVAGNYLVEGNANDMVKKLKKSGFASAEKVVFDLSEFHTVIAGRFSSNDSAKSTVEKLKAKGIDAYIKRK